MTLKEAFKKGNLNKIILTNTEIYYCKKQRKEIEIVDDQCDHIELNSVEEFVKFCHGYGRQNFDENEFLEQDFQEFDVIDGTLEIESELDFRYEELTCEICEDNDLMCEEYEIE